VKYAMQAFFGGEMESEGKLQSLLGVLDIAEKSDIAGWMR